MLRFSVILSCLFVVGTSAVYAQSAQRGESERKVLSRSDLRRLERSLEQFTGYYDEALKAVRYGSSQFDYDVSRLRQYYPKTAQYSPFAKSIIDEMTEYAYIADTSDDRGEVNDALIAYKKLLWAHLVNFDVLMFATRMSRVDERLGDEVLFKKVGRSLGKVILHSRTKCKNPSVACAIFSYGEEDYILGKIGGVLKKSKIYNISNRYYNVHDLLSNGQEIQVYIDVTAPIVNVINLQNIRQQDSGLAVLPQ